jgi:hypothetical protein
MEPMTGFAPRRRRFGRSSALSYCAHRSNRRYDFLRSGVMDHMAAPEHIAKRARAQLSVQTCRVFVSLNDTIIRSSNQANRNTQFLVKPTKSPGRFHQHCCFFCDRFDLGRP